MVEPIQGEAGVNVPSDGYLKKCFDTCKKNNVLFIADEIQTGLGRTGRMFCCDHEQVRPDIICMGKALGGGVYPVSAIVADNEIMMAAFEPGNHGSTFGGNPMASAVAMAALDVIIDEHLAERAQELGTWFRAELKKIKGSLIKEVRGKGLLTGVELNEHAHDYSLKLMERGVLAKESHGFTIRFAPPLVISKEDLASAVKVITEVLAK